MSLGMIVKKNEALDDMDRVRAQLDELTHMLEMNANCVDVMTQIQTVQSSLDRASHMTLHRHMETCFSNAVLRGRGRMVGDDFVDAVESARALTGPHTQPHASAIGRSATSNSRRRLSATTLTLPGIASRTCKAAIERVICPIAGVGAAEVDVLAKSVTIYHDYRAPAQRLIEAIEEQGYHVSDASVTISVEKTEDRHSRWQQGGLGRRSSLPTATEATFCGSPGDQCAIQAGPGFVDGDGI
jgi:DNA-binding FrmR family transcriptional regulator/copper chaperone CopZ